MPRGVRMSPEMDAQITSLKSQGKRISEICSILGLARSVVRSHFHPERKEYMRRRAQEKAQRRKQSKT